MGETSVDTQREIESLRDDVSVTIAELERRARRVLDVKAQAEEHPAALGVVGFGVLAGLAVLGYNAVSEYRESRKPVGRLKRRASSVADDLGERWGRTRDALPMRVSMRNREGEEMTVSSVRGKPGPIKKLLWAGLTAGTVALAGLLARRVSSVLWEKLMREPPPTSKV